MDGTSQPSPRVTNADLALVIGVINTKVAVIEATTQRLDKALNGNGKPGFIEDLRCLDIRVNNHISEDTQQRARNDAEKKALIDKREKFSGRTWAIVLSILGAFITQTVGLIYLFIRTGTIH